MNQDDKKALLEFVRGASFVIIVVGLFLIFITSFGRTNIKQELPEQSSKNFEVVDHYKECDVVRYTNNDFAQYKYFLHCPK